MFPEPITLRDAVITAVHLKMSDGRIQTRIGVKATLNRELAALLGAESLVFHENGTPREGFTTLQLDTGCAAFRATFEADPALKQSFELASGDSTDQYSIKRLDDGVLSLRFRLNYHGDAYKPLAYWEQIGDSSSLLKITPLQSQMDGTKAESDEDEDEEAEADEDQDDLFAPQPVDESTREHARQTLITGRRHGRKQALQRA